MKYSFLIFAAMMTLLSCGNTGGTADKNSVNASYQTAPAVITTNGVEADAKLSVTANGTMLKLEIKVKNISQNSITLDPSMISLYADSIMNTIYDLSGGGSGIVAGKDVSITVYFKPVNDPYMMQKYNLPGDMEKSYSLPISFVIDDKEMPVSEASIQFTMTDADYEKYIAEFGIDNSVKGFELSVNNQAFIDGQSKYMVEKHMLAKCEHDNEGTQHSHEGDTNSCVNVSGNEIISENLMIKMIGYQAGKDLYIYFRVISRMPDELVIDPKLFEIRAGDGKYAPANDPLKDLTDNKIENGKLILGLNERAELLFRYTPGAFPYTLAWDLNGFTTSKGTPVFFGPVSFTNTGIK
ncbi:MAG: hypothetical protein A2Y33_11385 [Spirochaetes bacterium GWF1_51_8]|nr:MAG: hypothetical protein A2Y33_11385 [Spirochaetes bacterium GWF1_51_8]